MNLIMKSLFHIAILTFFTALTLTAQEDGIVRYFSKQIHNDQFEHAYISPRMISAVSKMDVKDMDAESKATIKDLKGMRILSTKSGGKKWYEDAVKSLDTKGYETVMSARKKSENVQIYLKNEDKPDGELIMVLNQNEACTMTSFHGKINLDKIAKLARSLNIGGSEYLENMKKK